MDDSSPDDLAPLDLADGLMVIGAIQALTRGMAALLDLVPPGTRKADVVGHLNKALSAVETLTDRIHERIPKANQK